MEENKVVETTETTVATVEDGNTEVVNVTVMEPAESGDNTLLGVAIGAGLFALGLGAVKGVKHLIKKHKQKKAAKEAEFDDFEEVDDFDDFEEVEIAEEQASEPVVKESNKDPKEKED